MFYCREDECSDMATDDSNGDAGFLSEHFSRSPESLTELATLVPGIIGATLATSISAEAGIAVGLVFISAVLVARYEAHQKES